MTGASPVYRAVLVVDARAFSEATSRQQASMSAEIPEVLEAAFGRAGLTAEWNARGFRARAHTGDGYIVGLLPQTLPRLLDPFLRELQQELRERDRERPRNQARLRLRASIEVGPLPEDGAGKPMTDTHRLLDSDGLRQALAASNPDVTFLAAVVSKRVFDDWVAAGHTTLHPTQFRRFVARAKRFEQEAYLYVPERSFDEPHSPTSTPASQTRARPHAAIHQEGSNNVIGVVATGPNSSATHHGDIRVGAPAVRSPQPVVLVLDGLLQQLDRHAAELASPERARSLAQVLRDEVAQTDPDPILIRQMVTRLRAAVDRLGPLSQALDDLAEVLAAWGARG